jgi:hypothetical protein
MFVILALLHCAVPGGCVEICVRHIPHHHSVHPRRLTAYVELDGVHEQEQSFPCNFRLRAAGYFLLLI